MATTQSHMLIVLDNPEFYNVYVDQE